MNIHRLITLTVDCHDASVPLFIYRCNEIDAKPYVLAKDIGSHCGLKADDDGDYRSILTEAGIPFLHLEVSHKGDPLGPHALLMEADAKRMRSLARHS